MKPLVIYHADCTDGFGAAFAAWLKLGDEAEYLPMQYGNRLVEKADIWQREVYVLDFSFPREEMNWLFEGAKRVVWLDHHKTAFEMWEVEGYLQRSERYDIEMNSVHRVTLDNNKSGALLAWEYFHPGTEVPMLIRHIDDRDRWQFKLEGSKELHAALASMKPWSFGQWETLLGDPDAHSEHYFAAYNTLIRQGAAILRAQDAHIQSMLKQARKCVIPNEDVDLNVKDSCQTCSTSNYGKIRCPCSACPGWSPKLKKDQYVGIGRRLMQRVPPEIGLAVNTPMHMSEVGDELANQSGTYGLVWYVGNDNRAKCSLRSNGDYDVSAIAKSFGGGGHKNAAGFETDIGTLMKWLA